MATTDQLNFFVARKLKKLVWLIFLKFKHHIPSNILLKFKIAVMDEIHYFLFSQKIQN